MNKAVIIDGLRTPFGKYKGSLKKIRPDDLAAFVLKEIYNRNQLQNFSIDEVVLGCVNQAGEDNRNIARMSLLLAGIPYTVPGITVNRLCGSGQEAIYYASSLIETGKAKIVLAGGVESMTRSPYVMLKPQSDFERGNHDLVDTTIGWRFPNTKLDKMYPIISLGEAAEFIADKFSISRVEQDEFSFRSHQNALNAKEKFSEEIIPYIENEKNILSIDEHIREDINLEKLSELKTIFKKNGTITAGNSSGINDGAAISLLMEKDFAIANGFKPIAEIYATSTVGVDPKYLGTGPIPASNKVLANSKLTVNDISLWEISEAFASMTLCSIKELKLKKEIVNVNGGGISIGHPLGASGARMIFSLAKELKRRNGEFGISTMCIGVGQGISTILKSI